jgi:hypothetical protein
MWPKSLSFEALITATILRENLASGIPICKRSEGETATALAQRISQSPIIR